MSEEIREEIMEKEISAVCETTEGTEPSNCENTIPETSEAEEVEEETSRICPECGEVITEEDEIYEFEGDVYHKRCLVFCEHCDEILGTQSTYGENSTYISDVGEYWCSACTDNYASYCDHCENFVSNKTRIYTVNTRNTFECWCDDCVDKDAFYCEHCEEYYSDSHHSSYRIYINEYDSEYWCDDCMDDYSFYCEDCGRNYACDNVSQHGEFCEYCEPYDENGEYLWDYSTRPAPIFHKTENDNPESNSDFDTNNLYLGIEEEIDGGGQYDENAREIRYVGNNNSYNDTSHIYIKTDGSLDEGMEIVSHPCTYDYHKNKFPWEAIMSKAKSLGYKSHNAGTCGLHIHVNRSFFGSTETEQSTIIARIVYFCELYYDAIVKFSRREREQLSWCKTYYGSKNKKVAEEYSSVKDIQEKYQNIKNDNYRDRYLIVNLWNTNTIEFRIFRGTLKYSTFIATLQFVDGLCKIAKNTTDEEWFNMDFTTVVNRIIAEFNYTELKNYCEDREIDLSKSTIQIKEFPLSEASVVNKLLLASDIPEDMKSHWELQKDDIVRVERYGTIYTCTVSAVNEDNITVTHDYFGRYLTVPDAVEFVARPLTTSPTEAKLYRFISR